MKKNRDIHITPRCDNGHPIAKSSDFGMDCEHDCALKAYEADCKARGFSSWQETAASLLAGVFNGSPGPLGVRGVTTDVGEHSYPAQEQEQVEKLFGPDHRINQLINTLTGRLK